MIKNKSIYKMENEEENNDQNNQLTTETDLESQM